MRTVLLSDLVNQMLAAGQHPRAIKAELRRRGMPVQLGYAPHQGGREKARRLRQGHLCANACGRTVPADRDPRICDVCLAAKWSG